MAMYFTPDFDPPALPENPTEEQRAFNTQIGTWLKQLSAKIDEQMEAYISQRDQLADSLINTDKRAAFTVLQATANLAIGGATSISFTYGTAPSKQPLTMLVCTTDGWLALVRTGSTAAGGLTANVYNGSTSTAGVTIYACYL